MIFDIEPTRSNAGLKVFKPGGSLGTLKVSHAFRGRRRLA